MRLERSAISVILAVLVWTIPAVASSQEFKIVVNQANAADAIGKQQLADIFMKKTGKWGNGQQALPVDLVASSSTRQEFSKVIFERDTNAIKSYWQRQIFSGRGVPPPEKDSEGAVLEFIRANPGAIGYVSSDANIGSGVKVLEIDGT